MIQVEIPKDIRKYESKLVGPFTTRQTICFSIAAVIAVLLYFFIGQFVAGDVLFFIIFVGVSPALIFGWLKPYGMTCEHFLATAFVSLVISPKYRKYRTQNAFAPSKSELQAKKAERKKKYKKRKNSKEFIAYN